jgi:hypothetical protein
LAYVTARGRLVIQSGHPVQLRRLLDLAATGFDPGEVDAIMGDVGEDRANPADEPGLRSRK